MRAVFLTAAKRCAAVGLFAMILTACQSHGPRAMSAKGPLIQSASPCIDFSQTLYFEAGQATVTRQAEKLINLAATRTRGCRVTGVAVVGLSDAPGDPAANLELSRRRGEAVKSVLHRHGYDAVEIQVAAVGDSGAQTAAGQSKPVRRRAEIAFHLAPPPPR